MADSPRLRIRRRAVPQVNRLAELDRLMNEMAEAVRAREAWQAEEARIMHAIRLEVETNDVKEHVTQAGTVTYEEHTGRGSRTIDVRAFQELVMPEDFIECVRVSITAAKKVLTDKEIEEICEVTKAGQTTEELVFRLPETPAKRRGRKPSK